MSQQFLTLTVLLAVISLLSSSEAFPNTTFLSLNICIKSTIVSAASVDSTDFFLHKYAKLLALREGVCE